MKKKFYAFTITMLFGLMAFTTTLTAQVIRYVKAGAAGTGTSWANASGDLQAMINASTANDQVWVAKGTYKPTTTTDRTISFSLKEGVKIYGSFAGTETALSQHTLFVIAANPSILSGDLLGNDAITGSGSSLTFANNAENSYHVIANDGISVTAAAVLDGFTITGGNANGNGDDAYGGGIFLGSSFPTIANCSFSGNIASLYGGGMYNYASSPTITNCNFSLNRGNASGGGMCNYGSFPNLINVTFSGNNNLGNGGTGGGIANLTNSAPGLTNVTFSGNNTNNVSDGAGAFFQHLNNNNNKHQKLYFLG